MKIRFLCLAGLMLATMIVGAERANAAFVTAPVPTNAYITQGGRDWAWAGPLAAVGLDLSYQSQFGWHIPTAAELAYAPLATDFLVAGGNVPYLGVDGISGAKFSATNAAYTAAGSAGAVAVPYFNNTFQHADWQDGLGQTYGPWYGMTGALSFGEQLVVRSSQAVPEPTSLALFSIGVVGMALGRRNRKQKALAR